MRDKTGRNAADILCPFFRAHGPLKIGCEGIVDKSYINIIFDRTATLRDFETERCQSDYRSCGIYKAIMHKYEEEYK